MFEQAITLSFKTFNNEAEYEALLAGLRMAKNLAEKKPSIPGQRFGKVLPRIWHQVAHVHVEISSKQWASRSIQQNDPRLP
ncbi:hypothetical protein ACFX12_041095 [Malus domestica]